MSHASQPPAHSLSQQTPSAQKELSQSVGAVQGSPFAPGDGHAPATQTFAAQSSGESQVAGQAPLAPSQR